MLTKDTLEKVSAMGAILKSILEPDQVNALVAVVDAIKEQAVALESAKADFDLLASSYSNGRADVAELRAQLADEKAKVRTALITSAIAGCAADPTHMPDPISWAALQVGHAERVADLAMAILYPEAKKVSP